MTYSMKFILVLSPAQSDHINPSTISVRNVSVLAILLSTHSTALCPLCAQPGHDCSNCSAQACTCAKCGGSHDVFYRGCPTNKFESEEVNIRFKLGLALCEARQKAGQWGSALATYSCAVLHSSCLPFPSKMFLHLPQHLFLLLIMFSLLPLSVKFRHSNPYSLLALSIASDNLNVPPHLLLHPFLYPPHMFPLFLS